MTFQCQHLSDRRDSSIFHNSHSHTTRVSHHSQLEKQETEAPYMSFSFMNADRRYDDADPALSGAGGLVRCAKTYTNEATHEV